MSGNREPWDWFEWFVLCVRKYLPYYAVFMLMSWWVGAIPTLVAYIAFYITNAYEDKFGNIKRPVKEFK